MNKKTREYMNTSAALLAVTFFVLLLFIHPPEGGVKEPARTIFSFVGGMSFFFGISFSLKFFNSILNPQPKKVEGKAKSDCECAGDETIPRLPRC